MAQKSKPSAKPVKRTAAKSTPKPAKKAKAPASKAAPHKPAAKAPKKALNGAANGAEKQGMPIRAPRDPKSLAFYDRSRQRLLELRDHFVDQMQSVAQNSLRSRSESNEASAVGQHQADAGSDAYEKDFALSLLSQEQDALYEIEEALKRIELGTYGVCEMSGKAIPHTRLEAIPFARFTVECQQQLEKENRGRRRWDTAPQFMDSAEAFADEEEESTDDDDKKKDKE
jgi:RNA polymerase-binding transcription factor DksA